MSAPKHAKPIGLDGFSDVKTGKPKSKSQMKKLRFKCQSCGYIGHVGKLLGVDPDENTTLWCPRCRTSAWEWL
jgi:hypothetical protein